MRSAPRYDPLTLPIARVGRPHGVHGALHVHPFNPDSVVLQELPVPFPVQLDPELGADVRAVHVESVRAVPGGLLVRFAGIEDRDQAAAHRGALLRIARALLPPLATGEYYPDDLPGCVAESQHGAPLGQVVAVFSNGAQLVIVVQDPAGRELMVPLVPAHLVSVDPGERRVRVRVEEAEPAEPAEESR